MKKGSYLGSFHRFFVPKLGLVLFVLVSLGLSISDSRGSDPGTDLRLDSILSSHMFRPCSFWTYHANVQGFVCVSPDMNIRVPDAMDVQFTVNALETKVKDLEERVRKLESTR